jgi:apolipoprotein N-acyltransferase
MNHTAEAKDVVSIGNKSDKHRLLVPFLWALAAGASFQIAWQIPSLNCAILFYAYALIKIADSISPRIAFRFGFLAGIFVFAPQLFWFWKIFGPPALCLWAVLSFFTGLFVLMLQVWQFRHGSKFIWVLAPVFWTGLEFFRSELYFLRFSWLSAGYVFSGHSGVIPIRYLGVYGCGFLVFLAAAFLARQKKPKQMILLPTGLIILALLTSFSWKRGTALPSSKAAIQVAGIQLEFPPDLSIPGELDDLLTAFPETQVFVLSEYTFDAGIPDRVRQWCREHKRFLIAGGKKEAASPGQFYNTAFVVGPDGSIVFEQAKSVPIQFFKDGLPAPKQEVWHSPWGKIGICVCYDMSYRRVVDKLIRQGAEALIVPFMDVSEWGEHQHWLHSRIASIRAREYSIPIFRVGSSGISQLVDRFGRVTASAPFPGQEKMIGGELHLSDPTLPLDIFVAPLCSILIAVFLAAATCRAALHRVHRSDRKHYA